MPTTVQFRRGTTAQNDNFTGAVGEISIDTTLDQVRVHDGATQGGFKVGRQVDVDDRMQVANAQALFSTAVANLVSTVNVQSYMAVSNAQALFSTVNANNMSVANTRALVNDRLGATASVTLTGDVTGSGSFSSNAVSIALTDTNLGNTNLAIADRMQVANVTSAIATAVSDLVDSAPATLDTLNELAAALGDDENFATTLTTNLGQKLGSTATVTLTGDLTASETAFSSNAVSLSTTLADTGTPTGTFGSGSLIPVITVDSKGRITNISNTSVAGVSSVAYTAANSNFRISTADGTTYDAVIATEKMSVANTQALHTSITANLNSYIANTNPRITNILTSVGSTNTALRTIISNNEANTVTRLANVDSSIITANTRITNALTSIGSTNTAIRAIVANHEANTVTRLDNRMTVANTQALVNARLGATATVEITGDVAGGPTAFSGNTVSIAVTQQNNSVDLGTHTTGNYVATISGTANEVEVSGSGSEGASVTIGLPDDVTVAGQLSVGENVVVSGNLIVSGTTTTVNSEEVNIANTKITLNSDLNGATPASEDAGIIVNRGSDSDVSFIYDEGNDRWTLGSEQLVSGDLIPNTDSAEDLGTTSVRWRKLYADDGDFSGDVSVTGDITVTGSINATIEGQANTAAALSTAREIALGGDLSGSADFDGSQDITIIATVADDSHNHVISNVDGLQDALDNRMTVANTQALADARLGATATVEITGAVAGGATAFSSNAVSIAVTQQNNSVTLGTHTTGNYVGTITGGTGIASTGATSGEGIAHTLSVDLSELTDMTATMVGTDEFIVLDAGADRRKAASEIGLSIFNNDSGFSTTTGTVTSVNLTAGNLIDVSGGPITSSGSITVNVDLSELTDGTDAIVGGEDELVYLDNGSQKRKLVSEIAIGQFNTTNQIALGTDTTGNYIATISGTTNEVEVSGSGSETAGVTIGLPNDVTLTGDLTVSGGDITLGGTGRIQGIDTVSSGTDAANKTYVDNAVAGVVDSAPAALDTLNELAAALGDDANFATTVSTNIGQKLGATATVTLTGDVTASATAFSSNAVSISTDIASNVVGAAELKVTGNGSVDQYLASDGDGTFTFKDVPAGYTDSDVDDHLSGGTGIAYSSGTISVDLSELTDMTQTMVGTDEFIVLDAGADRRKAASEIGLSIFNNDSGFSTTTGTVTSHTVGAGDGLTGGGTVTSSGTTTVNVGAGTLIDVTADAVNVDLSELTTSTSDGDGDFFVVVDDANAQKKLTKGNINISGFNNDAGFSTTTGTVTSVNLTAGNLIDVSGGPVTSSGSITVDVDLSELTDGTADIVGAEDELVYLDNGSQKRKLVSEIAIGQFNTTNQIALATDTTGNYVSGISGTTNEIEVSGSGSENATVTIGLPNDVTLTGDLTVSGGDIVLGGTGRIQGVDTVSSGTDAANKTYVDNAVAGIVDSAPAALDTLNELAAALGDDANFATTVATNLGQKLGATATVAITGAVAGGATAFSSNSVSIAVTQQNNSVTLGTHTTGNYVATITGGTGLTSSGATSGEGIAHTLSVDYGTSSGTACQGNDARLSDSRTCDNTFDNASTARSNLGLGSLATLSTVNAATITDNSVGAAELNVSGNGSAGQYLESDGDGTFTWSTVSAGATVESKSDDVDYNVIFTAETSGTQDNAFINASKLYFNPSSGTLNATDFNSLSDEKYKENIESIENASDVVSQLQGRSFTWKETGKNTFGVIAQELEQVLPELVKESNSGDKTVNYLGLIAFLIESNKELQTRLDALEKEVMNGN